MNVYTYLISDFVNWPFAVEDNIYLLPSGGKIIVPRVAWLSELWSEFYLSSLPLLFDFTSIKNIILNDLEFVSLLAVSWLVKQSHAALVSEFEYALNVGFDDYLYQPSLWLVQLTNASIVVVIFYLTILYIYSYGLRNNTSSMGMTEGGIFLYAYLDEVEEECGQVEDIASYLVYFAIFSLWFFFFNIFASAIILKYLNWLLVVFCFILLLGVVVPSNLLVQIGLAFAQYVRGSGRSTSLVFETLLDFVSVSVIIIRFFVQNIRFVFIFVGFFEYYEYIESKIQPMSTSLIPYISWSDYWVGAYSDWYWFEILLQVFVQVVSYVYYVGHLIITYIAQLSVYIILSFWIFFFLYTTFSLPSKEKYFYFKRYALLIK